MEDRELIELAMRALEPMDSQILRLIFIEGKSSAEAADELGVTPGCASCRLYRARRRFTEIYIRLLKDD